MREKQDPLKTSFREQRNQAKRRGIPFLLAYWEWLQIWQDSGHLHERGNFKGEWVMGRKGDIGAYEAGNVIIIRAETNTAQNNSLRLGAVRKSNRKARR